MSDDTPGGSRQPVALQLRRPVEADHGPIVALVDEWWGGRRLHDLLPRLWFQHFVGTSWVAETADRRLAGFLVGFISPDRPDEAYIHMVAANPNLRRQHVGRTLYDAFFADVAKRGVRRVGAITWPGNRQSVAFHTAMGFRIVDGPGTQPIYGVVAYPDYDAPDEDRTVFVREILSID